MSKVAPAKGSSSSSSSSSSVAPAAAPKYNYIFKPAKVHPAVEGGVISGGDFEEEKEG